MDELLVNNMDGETAPAPVICKHYAEIDGQSRVVALWNDAVQPWRLNITPAAVLLGEWGGAEIKLSPNGEEDPMLLGMDGIPLYKWDGTQVMERTQEEIEADRAALPVSEPAPTAEDVLNALLGVTV